MLFLVISCDRLLIVNGLHAKVVSVRVVKRVIGDCFV